MKRAWKIAVRLALALSTLAAAASVVGALGLLPGREFNFDTRWFLLNVDPAASFWNDELNGPSLRLRCHWKGMSCGCWDDQQTSCRWYRVEPFGIPQLAFEGHFLGAEIWAFDILFWRAWNAMVPHPLLAVLFGAWPLLALVAWIIRRRRVLPTACPGCGYDLTGNVTGRCPECGAAAQSAAGSRLSS